MLESIESGEASQTLSPSFQIYLTPELAQTIEASSKQASLLSDEFVSTEHVLLAMVDVRNPVRGIMEPLGVTYEAVLQVLAKIRGGQQVTDQEPETKFQVLEKYGQNLTKIARMGKLDPVIGRDLEIRRVMQVLSRRTKNNPVLIGEPGTGVT